MKSKSQKSRISLSKDELDTIKELVELWIKVDKEELKNTKRTVADIVLEKINYSYNDKKEKYTFNFDFLELSKIHDTLADGVLYYKKNIKIIKPLCKKIEDLISKNYGNLEICYPVISWTEILKKNKNQ